MSKVPKFDQNLTFNVNFLCQKLSEPFSIFFSFKNINLGAHFDNCLITSMFKSLHSLKWCPIFWTSSLTQFSKFNHFLWVCWFLGKNLSTFVPPVWKLHNPYCNTIHSCVLSLHFKWDKFRWKYDTFFLTIYIFM